jgi:hypothetical protein
VAAKQWCEISMRLKNGDDGSSIRAQGVERLPETVKRRGGKG